MYDKIHHKKKKKKLKYVLSGSYYLVLPKYTQSNTMMGFLG